MRLFAALPVALAVALLAPGGARAYDHQATIELGVGWSHAFGSAVTYGDNGIPVILGGSVGLSDALTVRAALTWAPHPGTPFTQVGIVGAELVYVFDLLEVVPYVGGGFDLLTTFDASQARADFGAHVVVGLDWLFKHGMYVGLEVRPYVVVTELDTIPVYLTLTARYGLIFDL